MGGKIAALLWIFAQGGGGGQTQIQSPQTKLLVTCQTFALVWTPIFAWFPEIFIMGVIRVVGGKTGGPGGALQNIKQLKKKIKGCSLCSEDHPDTTS